MKERKREEEVVLVLEVWRKVKKHCGGRELLPQGAIMSMEGWTMQWEVVTLVEYRGCDYKGTKTQENKGQSFLSKRQSCNMWCGNCKEVWNWREEEAESGRAERVECSTCRGKNTVVGGKVERNEKGVLQMVTY